MSSFKIPQHQVGEVLVRLTGTNPDSRMADRYRSLGDNLAAPGLGQKPSKKESVSIEELRRRADRVAAHWDEARPRPGTDHLIRREVDQTTAQVLRDLDQTRLAEILASIRRGDPAELLRI